MANETIKALKKSIKHWEDMRDEKESRDHSTTEHCALCQLFYISSERDCTECPVKAKSGQNLCAWTPYETIVTTESAQKMVTFLRDILIAELEKIIEKTPQGEDWLDLVKSIEPQPKKEPELVEKWIDITSVVDWNAYKFGGSTKDHYWLMGSYEDDEEFIYLNANGIKLNHKDYEENYRIDKDGNQFRIMKKAMVLK